MTEYLTEQEQIQQLKNWIKQYSPTVLAGIVIALIISVSWHYWQSYRNKMLTQASITYDEMLTLRTQNNASGISTQANKLLTHYAKTPYAQMAALMLAREAVSQQKYPEALAQLNWIVNNSSESSLRDIARIRIARIMLLEKQADAALTILNKVDSKNFLGLAEEIKGDIYSTQNNPGAARKAYQLALATIPNAEISRPLLQMKYDNLATTEDKKKIS